MKKAIPYIIGGLFLLLLGWVVFSTRSGKHVFDDRITFNKRDKIPYGTYVAFQQLPKLFPQASVSVNKKRPSQWDSLDVTDDKQAIIIISPYFQADESELNHLLEFAEAGNSVFISSRKFSYDAQNFFNCSNYATDFSILGQDADSDSLRLGLLNPPFSDTDNYEYPGRQYDSYFGKYDAQISNALGEKDKTNVNFIQLKAGKGNIFLHLAPIAFCNYFLLHHHNIEYYNKTLSLIPPDTKTVVWDEYFLYKRSSSSNNKSGGSPLSALMSQRSFRAALWILLLLALLFIFQEMRRKQRVIPFMAKPRNDSLEFVKTIGRLYYEKRDNKNLARKMSSYFLEHIRNRYKLSTVQLDREFILSLQRKTGRPEKDLERIISFIYNLELTDEISDKQLADFHMSLEEFYQTG